MRKTQGTLLALAALLCVSILLPGGSSAGEASSATAAKAINAFALDLYPVLRNYAKAEYQQENLFFSPYSVSTVLAMTLGGARGKTEAQMAKVLHLTSAREEVQAAFGQLNRELSEPRSEGSDQLLAANALWAQKGYGFRKEFLELLRKNYENGLQEIDFSLDPEAARQAINKWVETLTKEKIVELVPPNVIDALTRLVLTNAIYFNGTWSTQFNRAATREAPFTVLDGSKTSVPMMHCSAKFGYTKEQEFQVLELPYRGDRFSMVVFLPNESTGLEKFEKSLTLKKLSDALSNLKRVRVSVSMPRFKISTPAYRLDSSLKTMGMADAFSPDADFSGMVEKKELKIQAVLHKAFVEVTEEGTEAAAATAAVIGLKATRPSPAVDFRADHPFLFLIRDVRSNCILFIGRFTKP